MPSRASNERRRCKGSTLLVVPIIANVIRLCCEWEPNPSHQPLYCSGGNDPLSSARDWPVQRNLLAPHLKQAALLQKLDSAARAYDLLCDSFVRRMVSNPRQPSGCCSEENGQLSSVRG
ncbi:hypothetical protein GN244_ATG16156 [Phytophthora infestans]|uniref:Uncharacterized protein n=1 Tax=Phytophthora infestans TaxID=4787 RepID=A0A833SBC6_PHYIN|nr:hypothetical protein GN244_ATG16156 [Phytophthora infestans]